MKNQVTGRRVVFYLYDNESPFSLLKMICNSKIKRTLKISIIFSSILILATISLSSCGPDNPTPNYQMVPQESKDWGVFKEGTWWVYEEETLKYRDSVYVFFTRDH